MSEKCFGEDNIQNLFGEDNVRKMVQGVQCPKILGRTMSENTRGDNVQREVMSICFRESNTNKRSGNSKTRGANGLGVIMTICFRGSNVREDFFSGRTIF